MYMQLHQTQTDRPKIGKTRLDKSAWPLYMKTCFLRTSRCTTPTPNYLLNSIVFADNANNPWRFVRQAPANSGAQTPYCRLKLIRFIKLLYKVILLCYSKNDLQNLPNFFFFILIDNTRQGRKNFYYFRNNANILIFRVIVSFLNSYCFFFKLLLLKAETWKKRKIF